MQVVVLGAGFGGLEACSALSEALGDSADILLVDRSEGFVFGFSKLDVMFGRETADAVVHPYVEIAKPGVRFLQATVRSIDPVARRVVTDKGTYDADVLLIALGADLVPEVTPGLAEAGHEFYTVPGAFALREVLDSFDGGHVVVGVTSTPFKCPPAPSETALLVHDLLATRGLLDRSQVSLVMPLPVPIPPSPDASKALLAEFAERGIAWHPQRLIRGVDGARRTLLLSDGDELAYDLLLAVPVHRAPQVVIDAGLTEDGWIPVDPLTLETRFPGVYAVGDVTSVGTPKAGVFAEGQAAVAAARIIAATRDEQSSASYDGRGLCYLEFGGDTRSRRWTSPSGPGRRRSGRWKGHRRRWRPTSGSSARVGSRAGSAAEAGRASPISRAYRQPSPAGVPPNGPRPEPDEPVMSGTFLDTPL